jgi:uncharacterized protein (TIGR02453 family)
VHGLRRPARTIGNEVEPVSSGSAPAASFGGWSQDAVAFFAELERNNNKEWWTANKDRYETLVLDPMRALATELEPTFGPMSIKRPHRDVRFSTDKSPYKTTIAGGIDGPGGMLYGVQFSASELSVVAGHFEFAPDQLARFRAALDDSTIGSEFDSVVALLTEASYRIESFSALKSVPRGFSKDHQRAEHLARKGIHVGRSWPTSKMPTGKKATASIAEVWGDASPLMDFLAKHVGQLVSPAG